MTWICSDKSHIEKTIAQFTVQRAKGRIPVKAACRSHLGLVIDEFFESDELILVARVTNGRNAGD